MTEQELKDQNDMLVDEMRNRLERASLPVERPIDPAVKDYTSLILNLREVGKRSADEVRQRRAKYRDLFAHNDERLAKLIESIEQACGKAEEELIAHIKEMQVYLDQRAPEPGLSHIDPPPAFLSRSLGEAAQDRACVFAARDSQLYVMPPANSSWKEMKMFWNRHHNEGLSARPRDPKEIMLGFTVDKLRANSPLRERAQEFIRAQAAAANSRLHKES